MSRILLASLTASATFGLIDTFNFVFVEDSLSAMWKNLGFTNQQTIDILNAGISSAISIMVAVLVENYISRYFEVHRTATLDAIGVIAGTVIALVLIKLKASIFPDRTPLKASILKAVAPGSDAEKRTSAAVATGKSQEHRL